MKLARVIIYIIIFGAFMYFTFWLNVWFIKFAVSL